jgi:glycosyltransferase involved in cell wall biosynthesis
MKVCVYTIMRDEEANVAAWAETTVDADMRFVLDTGSTDRTIAELSIHGVMTEPAVFEPFRFDDARNCALALAPDADLYLRLDADERLPDDWRVRVEDMYHPGMPRYRYLVRNHGVGWGLITRDDLHRRDGFRWKYPTHEVLTGPASTVTVPGLVIEHHPPTARRPHHDTNLKTLQRAVIDYPNDPRMYFYFARELWYTGNWNACRIRMLAFLDLPGAWPAERSEAYRILAAIDYEPERWIWKAIGESPDRREPWVDLARHHLGQGNIQRAALAIFQADEREDDTIYTTDPQCWGEAYDALREDIAHHLADPMTLT